MSVLTSFSIDLNLLHKAPDMGFLKNHIEKILFVVLLLGLGMTLMVLMNLRNNRETVDSLKLVIPQQNLTADYAGLESLKARLTDDSPLVSISMDAFTPEVRVVCINPEDRSLIPADATHCPYCGMEQKEEERDSDGDGVPDPLELRWGLDPQNPLDVYDSIDGTGFSVRVQHSRGHDPTDSSDYPPHIEFLRLLDVQEETIRFEFRGFTQIAEDVYMVQLRYRYPDQNEWQSVRVRTGDDPTGQDRNRFGRDNEFTAERFVQTGEQIEGRFIDQSNVLISGARTPFRLYRDGERSLHSVVKRTAVLHLYMGPEWNVTVQPDALFELDNKSYKVVDIQSATVVIADVRSDSQLRIRKATAEELENATPPQPEAPEAEFNNEDSFVVDPSMFF